jgi:hypothetical protein
VVGRPTTANRAWKAVAGFDFVTAGAAVPEGGGLMGGVELSQEHSAELVRRPLP